MTDRQNLHHHLRKVWANLPGWGALSAVNHSTIGLRFMVTGAVFFLIGGVLAMLARTQLALPEQNILDASVYNQVFTMHGTVMMFLFAIPVLEGMAIYLIPKMIGARDLVFPRITAFGYYCYLFGGLIILSSLFIGVAPDSGWFMYTPLSSSTFAPGPGSDFWLLGVTFVEISAMAAGIELTVSILRSRAPGMTLGKMPLFCWYILAMALMIVFGFPPLILASVLLELERAAGMPFFAVERGGDPLLWQHLFWLFGHPEVYILFLPAAGIVSTLIPVFAGRPIVGYRWIVVSIIVTGFISFGLWVHHMFTVGIPQLAQAFFSVASMLVAVPTAIQLFAWLATLWKGQVTFALPMLWIFGFLVIFVCGGLTGVMLALVPFNWQVHDTHFVVAHMHYVLVGGMFFPLIAGLYYWLPHLSGRMPSHTLGRWAFWLTFIGFNMTFLLMHLTGLLGMPRRIYTYEAGLGWDTLNLLSSVGGFVMAAGIAMLMVDVLLHFRFGRPAGRNPWRADTLEWATDTPPAAYNFASLPRIQSRHPLWDNEALPDRIDDGHYDLVSTEHQRRETWGTDAVNARISEVIHLPGNSWLPLLAALSLAALCISLLAREYWVALVTVFVASGFLLRWSWENGAHSRAAPPGPNRLLKKVGEAAYARQKWPKERSLHAVNEHLEAIFNEADATQVVFQQPANEPEAAPLLHSRTLDGPGRWGMIVTMLANGTLYLSLLFGWFYLWTAAPHWSVPEQAPVSLVAVVLAALLFSMGAWCYHRLTGQLRVGDDSQLITGVGWSGVLVAAAVLVLLWALLGGALAPKNLAHDAVITFMLLYLLFHGLLLTVLCLLQFIRVRHGYISAKLPYEPMVLQPLWIYSVGVHWLSVAAFLLLPMAWPTAGMA